MVICAPSMLEVRVSFFLRTFNSCIPAFLIVDWLSVWTRLMSLEVCICQKKLSRLDENPGVYLICVNILILSVATMYLYLSSGRRTHNVASYPLPDKSLLTEPYPCINMNGDLPTCNRGRCNGKWSRHGRIIARLVESVDWKFDHHCPWVWGPALIRTQGSHGVFPRSETV